MAMFPRAQLRGMEERVEQSTRELSMLGPETQEAGSEASSRVSTPAPGLGSCEDIGGSGLELQELNSLEKKTQTGD